MWKPCTWPWAPWQKDSIKRSSLEVLMWFLFPLPADLHNACNCDLIKGNTSLIKWIQYYPLESQDCKWKSSFHFASLGLWAQNSYLTVFSDQQTPYCYMSEEKGRVATLVYSELKWYATGLKKFSCAVLLPTSLHLSFRDLITVSTYINSLFLFQVAGFNFQSPI